MRALNAIAIQFRKRSAQLGEQMLALPRETTNSAR